MEPAATEHVWGLCCRCFFIRDPSSNTYSGPWSVVMIIMKWSCTEWDGHIPLRIFTGILLDLDLVFWGIWIVELCSPLSYQEAASVVDPKSWPAFYDTDDLPKKKLTNIHRFPTAEMVCYLDFSVSTTGMLAGIKVGWLALVICTVNKLNTGWQQFSVQLCHLINLFWLALGTECVCMYIFANS